MTNASIIVEVEVAQSLTFDLLLKLLELLMFMFDKAIMLVKVIRGDPIILHEDVGLERV